MRNTLTSLNSVGIVFCSDLSVHVNCTAGASFLGFQEIMASNDNQMQSQEQTQWLLLPPPFRGLGVGAT